MASDKTKTTTMHSAWFDMIAKPALHHFENANYDN